LGHTQGQWFLDIHVFAGLASMNHLKRVPVVWSANNDGIDVLLSQLSTVIVKQKRVRADLLRGEVQIGRIQVTDCDDLTIAVSQEGVEHLVAAVTESDEGEADTFVGAENPSAAHGAKGGCGGCLAQIAARWSQHVPSPN